LVKQLVKGEKVVINKINEYSNNMIFNILYENKRELSFDIDVFLFMLDNNNRINKNEIIFYNNPKSIGTKIKFNEHYEDTKKRMAYEADLNSVPENITRLIFGCSIYKFKSSINKQLKLNITLKVFNKTLQTELFNLDIENDIKDINSLILGEVYKHNELWKFSAVEYSSDKDILNSIRMIYNTKFY
jgi:stress response protein SCP2